MENIILEIISKKTKIKGIIQVGSNSGQEINQFRKYTNNIICFEPIPSVFEKLKSKNPDLKCFNFALGDENTKLDMYISSNNGESSSFRKPLNHTKSFSDITFNQVSEFEIKRFDSLDIDSSKFNFLVSDTQGYEISVFEGFGAKIKDNDFIYVEYIENNLYENDCNLNDIINYLEKFGFTIELVLPEMIGVFGNALFINKKIK